MGPNWGHMGWWGMGLSWLVLAVLLVGIVVLIIVLLRLFVVRDAQHSPPHADAGRARAILDERYARGEIDTAEYEERRTRLDRTPES